MKIGDAGVDKFGKRVYIEHGHEDYWDSDPEMKMYRSLSYYLDTSGLFWNLRLDSDIQK